MVELGCPVGIPGFGLKGRVREGSLFTPGGAPVQESVDVIGLSIMSGAHLPITRKLMKLKDAEGLDDVRIVVGGVIPRQDISVLTELGVHAVFPGGTSFEAIIQTIKEMF